MAQIHKMNFQIEIKSSADKYYNFYKSNVHLLPKISPREIKGVKLVEGDWDSVGSVKVWTHTLSGAPETLKETTETIDDESKTITSKFLDGEILKYYTTFKPTMTALPSGKGCLAKWTVEFEKQNESIPDPIKYKDFVVSFSKNVDAYLLKA
ncbi:hypothetical protein COLO4_13137 [Corchorus olitorius]|uniref:Bet v I/Major latex protein domain-containing protein n=1 Tax=Corchorus olitorius TaxID=93759 RepID=A0A1R3JXX8_9ROSI|nr:hypothetical protein COLO4_13137 [Corchorus olitorius]